MSKIMTEASSLTPEQKMDLWHSGQRNENIKACGLQKLHTYFDICLKRLYIDKAGEILAECDSRGETPFHTLSDMKTTVPEALSQHIDICNEIKWNSRNLVYDEDYNNYVMVCDDALA